MIIAFAGMLTIIAAEYYKNSKMLFPVMVDYCRILIIRVLHALAVLVEKQPHRYPTSGHRTYHNEHAHFYRRQNSWEKRVVSSFLQFYPVDLLILESPL